MVYSKDEIMQYVLEEDVKFIRMAFCDIYGRQKNISIMPQELSRAFNYGIAVDASAIEGHALGSPVETGARQGCKNVLRGVHPGRETV